MGILDNIIYVPCHVKNHGAERKASDIKYLVYHYTGNDGDSDTNNAKYYQNTVVQASAHYFVDDDSITQSVDDLTIAWAVGGKKWSDCPQTGGGKLYGICTNANSISIEMCDTRRDGTLMATEQTLANSIELGKMLMAKYAIPLDRVVRHFDVTGKYCPAYFMDEAKWAAFKARLVEPEKTPKTPANKPTEKRYQTIEEIKKNAAWAEPTIRKLIEHGALNGTGTGLDLSFDMLRLFVIHDRMGVYDK